MSKVVAEVSSGVGAVVAGRGTYEAAEHWGDENPWGQSRFATFIDYRVKPS